MSASRLLGLVLFAASVVGCWSDPSSQSGVGEPVRVQYPDPKSTNGKLDAQFVSGTLPGTPAPKIRQQIFDAGPDAPPTITSKNSVQSVFAEGESGASFTGQATDNASGVGIGIDGVGSGYWVVPLAGVDHSTGDLTWSATVNFGNEIAPGNHLLRFVAIDGHGVAGPQSTPLPFCILNSVPDNLQECSPTRAPPQAVISLTWDTNVDLDLQVMTPDGVLVDPKHPFTTRDLTDAGKLPTRAGVFDRDSNAGCVIDGIRTENLVWKNEKPHGQYLIYANLFSACGQPAVRFEVSAYTSVPNPDGGVPHLKKVLSQGGELLGVQANGGSARGLYVASITF